MVTFTNLSNTLLRSQKYEESKESYHKALCLQRNLSGENHPNTRLTMQGLDVVLMLREKLDEAQRITEPAFDTMTITLCQDHSWTLSCSKTLGDVRKAEDEYIKAEKSFNKHLRGVIEYLVKVTLTLL